MRYNQYEGCACLLLERIDIRGSIHGKAQMKSSSSSCCLISFQWQQEPPVCLKMFSVTAYCAQRGIGYLETSMSQ